MLPTNLDNEIIGFHSVSVDMCLLVAGSLINMNKHIVQPKMNLVISVSVILIVKSQ